MVKSTTLLQVVLLTFIVSHKNYFFQSTETWEVLGTIAPPPPPPPTNELEEGGDEVFFAIPVSYKFDIIE